MREFGISLLFQANLGWVGSFGCLANSAGDHFGHGESQAGTQAALKMYLGLPIADKWLWLLQWPSVAVLYLWLIPLGILVGRKPVAEINCSCAWRDPPGQFTVENTVLWVPVEYALPFPSKDLQGLCPALLNVCVCDAGSC